jgi:hypothetical protein
MQLRVARLCLDCEEVFAGDVCPVCASEHSAFLSKWLPVEERRRWRRTVPTSATATQRRVTAIRQVFRDLFGDGTPVSPPGPPRTRRADQIPAMNFDDASEESVAKERPATERRPIRGEGR